MDTLTALAGGFAVAMTPQNLLWSLAGVTLGTADRRAARHRPGADRRPAASGHLLARSDVGVHHVRRDLLRRHVRRIDDVDPAEHAGRERVGDVGRRGPSDGARRPRRRGAGDRRDRFVRRRHAGARRRSRCARRSWWSSRFASGRRSTSRWRCWRSSPCPRCSASRGSTASPACCSGSLLGVIGIDPLTGVPRLTLGIPQLLDGIDVVVVAVGLFAVGEVLYAASRQHLDAEIDHVARIALDDARRVGAVVEAVAARRGDRLSARRAAGRRRRDSDVPFLRARAAAGARPERVRSRRDRRRGGTGGREQRGGGRHAGAAARARAADDRHGGDHAGRVSAVRPAAGAAAVPARAAARLGADRQPVRRQRDAAGAEPAAGRALGAAAHHPATGALRRRS